MDIYNNIVSSVDTNMTWETWCELKMAQNDLILLTVAGSNFNKKYHGN